MSDLVQRLRSGEWTRRGPEIVREAADRIEELELELAICREALEVAYEVVYNDWPKELDDDSDMAVRRCTLRRLQEAVGKAAPRLLGEAPEGQRMYGLHYRDLSKRIESLELALNEWLAKTDWIQETARAKELGRHRADILRMRIEADEALMRQALETLLSSAYGDPNPDTYWDHKKRIVAALRERLVEKE